MPLLNRKPRIVDWNNDAAIGRLSRAQKMIRLTTNKGNDTEGRLLRFDRTDSNSGMVRIELPTGPAHIGVRTDRDRLTAL